MGEHSLWPLSVAFIFLNELSAIHTHTGHTHTHTHTHTHVNVLLIFEKPSLCVCYMKQLGSFTTPSTPPHTVNFFLIFEKPFLCVCYLKELGSFNNPLFHLALFPVSSPPPP